MAGDSNERYRKDDHGRGPWVRSRIRQQPGFTRATDRNHGLYIPVDEMSTGEAATVERFLGNVNTEPVVMALCFFSAGEENTTATPVNTHAGHTSDPERHAGD